MSYSKDDYWEAMAYEMGETTVKWARGTDGEPLAKTYANLGVLPGMSGSVPSESSMDDYWANTYEPYLQKVDNFDLVKKRNIKNIMAELCSCSASEGETQAALYKALQEIETIKRKLGL